MLYNFTLYPLESVLETLLVIFIGLTGSTFWSIVMLAISVRLLTKPLEKITSVAVKNQAQFEAVLKPQLDAIKHEYSGSQRHSATTRLYARYAYHPIFAVRSLLGLFVQLPFFIAAYFMLSSFTSMVGVLIPILGDLGAPDTLILGRFHLLPFIMTFVNILALVTSESSDRKSLLQGLAISFVFLILLYESPLGLIIYWTTSNLFSLSSNLIPRIAKRVSLKMSLPSFRGSDAERFFEEYAYIFLVVNLAILVPLLGVLGDQFNLFTAHGMTGSAIISLLLIVMVLPAAVLSLLRWLAKLLGVVKAFDGVILTVFLGVFLTYLFNKIGYGISSSSYEPAILISIAMLVTGGSVVIILNSEVLRKMSYLSLVIPIVMLHFVFVSPASTLFGRSNGILGEKPEGINDTPVFLLVFDEFSGLTIQNGEGDLDVARYPSFAELARNADYFPNALTADYHTVISVPSIVSGTLRLGDKRGLASGENLIELFQFWGGGVRAQSSVLPADLMYEQQTNPYSFASDIVTLYLHIISHQDWIENQIGVIPPTWKGFGIFYETIEEIEQPEKVSSTRTSRPSHPVRLDILFDWFDELAMNEEKKQFNFLHVVYPHVPYTTTATGRLQSNSEKIRQQILAIETFNAEQKFLNVSYHNYLQQTSYAGVLLKEFIEVLKETGMYEKSLIIVTADHGVSYNAEGVYRRDPLTKDAWKNISSVPLIIKYPFQEEGRVNNSFVTTLDIAPTIMGVTGIVSPWDLAGENLRTIAANTQTKSVEIIPGYKDYFGDVAALFDESRSRKSQLFGVGSPVSDVAVNYTEDAAYSALLNTELSLNLVEEPSDLNAIWAGSIRPSEITYFGRIYHGSEPQNGKVIVAVVNNRIRAVFETGNLGEQSGKFAFSLPEVAPVPVEFPISLYEVEGVEIFALKKISSYSADQLSFQTKTIIDYDWKNAVKNTNGLDSLIVGDDFISALASTSNDPFVVMQSISDELISNPTIRIELESNKELILQLFYRTFSERGFSESKSQTYLIDEGNNAVYFEFSDTEIFGDIRLDFGLGGLTEIKITDIEVRY